MTQQNQILETTASQSPVVLSESGRGSLSDDRHFPSWDAAVDAAETRTKELEADGYIVWKSENIGKRWTAHCEPVESTVNYQPRPEILLEIVRS